MFFFNAVAALIDVILPLFQTISFVADYPRVTSEMFFKVSEMKMLAGRGLRILFSAIYSIAAFAPNPKKEIEE